MKKIIISIITIILIVLIGLYISMRYGSQGSLFCSEAGHPHFHYTSANGPDYKYSRYLNNECCEGLVSISTGLRYDSHVSYADENGCVQLCGGNGSVCSDCGNNICEDWENKCNCPNDCSDKQAIEKN
jgi:hypothetical protein